MTYEEFQKAFEHKIGRVKRKSRVSRKTRQKSRSQSSGSILYDSASTSGARNARRQNNKVDFKKKLQSARRFANTAKAIFRYFLPLGHKSPVAARYWGGVSRITSVGIRSVLHIRYTN
jgi:hypothetical protein